MTCVNVWAWTGPGKVRPQNEDCVIVGDQLLQSDTETHLHAAITVDSHLLVGVFDGMGGHRSGAHASRSAATAIGACMRNQALSQNTLSGAVLAQWLTQVDQELREQAANELALTGMGCTAAVLVITPEVFFGANVGDSPIYRLNRTYLSMLSEEHAYQHPDGRRVLTQALGGGSKLNPIKPQVFSQQLRRTERFVIASDGLTDELSLDRIESLQALPAFESGLAMFEAACDAGGKDNISIIVIEVSESAIEEGLA